MNRRPSVQARARGAQRGGVGVGRAGHNQAWILMSALLKSRRRHMENIWGNARTLLHDIGTSTHFGRFRHLGRGDWLRGSACRGQLPAGGVGVSTDFSVCLVLRIRRRQNRDVAHPCQSREGERSKARWPAQTPTLVSLPHLPCPKPRRNSLGTFPSDENKTCREARDPRLPGMVDSISLNQKVLLSPTMTRLAQF